MLAFVDYGLIVVFFLGVLVFVFLLAHPKAEEVAAHNQTSVVVAQTASVKDKNPSYIVIAVFFLLLVLAAFVSAKGSTHT